MNYDSKGSDYWERPLHSKTQTAASFEDGGPIPPIPAEEDFITAMEQQFSANDMLSTEVILIVALLVGIAIAVFVAKRGKARTSWSKASSRKVSEDEEIGNIQAFVDKID
ncbi:hypothetical protein MMC21_005450 [Puttea exsequens]|nr:hypothetical protein [Puttea exsequens]